MVLDVPILKHFRVCITSNDVISEFIQIQTLKQSFSEIIRVIIKEALYSVTNVSVQEHPFNPHALPIPA